MFEKLVEAAVATCEPPLKTLYPATAVLSLAADQLRSICVDETTVAFRPAGTVGAVMSATELLTVTETAAEVVQFPAASEAVALMLCDPLASVLVSSVAVYGAAAIPAPRVAPSTLNCTDLTPTLSEAEAVNAMLPETVCPAVGALMETVGAVVSATALLTVTATAAEVVLFPGGVGSRGCDAVRPVGKHFGVERSRIRCGRDGGAQGGAIHLELHGPDARLIGSGGGQCDTAGNRLPRRRSAD